MKTSKEAHEAQRRNFRRALKAASEEVKWFRKSLGGDGRYEEARELWYEAHPEKDVRKELVYEDDVCPDKDCLLCYLPPWTVD